MTSSPDPHTALRARSCPDGGSHRTRPSLQRRLLHGTRRGIVVALAPLLVLGACGAALASPAAFTPKSFPTGPGAKATQAAQQSAAPGSVPGRILVRFDPQSDSGERAEARDDADATLRRSYSLVPGLQLVAVDPGDEAAALASLRSDPAVDFATRDMIATPTAAPNDPRYSSLWGMPKIGAPAAWDRLTDGRGALVAVLDTGADMTHPDLQANLWTNPGETPGNGVDDDRNGYVDDVNGWNFVDGNANVNDAQGHGTHTAGTVGAVGNNGVGVAGVNWRANMMIVKVCGAAGCPTSAIIAGLQYAVANGAKVSNNSYGCQCTLTSVRSAIAAANAAGHMFVAAAGNNSADNDRAVFDPASAPYDNVISVAATSSGDGLAVFSNYGATEVDLAAPGDGILSTYPRSVGDGSGYATLSGTSMASPHVAGAAALLWAQRPTWSVAQVRTRLLGTTRPVAFLAGKVASGGILDIGAATGDGSSTARLTVAVRGTGGGSVQASSSGLTCIATSCVGDYPIGSRITLTATMASESEFAGWAGACSGTGDCTVSLEASRHVIARFRSTAGVPAGWSMAPLAPPDGRAALRAGDFGDSSHYSISTSADGTVRARTIFTRGGSCNYDSADTGGVFVERRSGSGWVQDARITSPTVFGGFGGRWPNCFGFGSITQLSRDGSTLLVSQKGGDWYSGAGTFQYGWCAAFVYRRGADGWQLDGTLFPQGMSGGIAPSADTCRYFGIGAAISDDGSRAAIMGAHRVDVFARSGSGYSLERRMDLPRDAGCGQLISPRVLAMSGRGDVLIAGDQTCDAGGQQGAGQAFAYTRSGSTWSLAQRISPPDPIRFASFGQVVAASRTGDTLVLGQYQGSGLPWMAGAAWVFERTGATWSAVSRLAASNPTQYGSLQCPTVVQNGRRIICTAAESIESNERQGALYVFDRGASGWAAAPTPTRVFANDGRLWELLGAAGDASWTLPGASEDGRIINLSTSPRQYDFDSSAPRDRMGYEVTAPSGALSGFRPESGTRGDRVVLSASDLAGATAVRFAGRVASFTQDSSTQITAVVPNGAAPGPITVDTPRGTLSSGDRFLVVGGTPPTRVSAATTGQVASVSFTPPADASGVTGYRATCRSSDGGTERSATGTASPISVTGLPKGRTYRCSVVAISADVESDDSLPSDAVTVSATAPDAPAAPVPTVSGTSVSLAVLAPADDGGSAVLDRTVACTPSGPGTHRSATGTAASITVHDLTRGVAYTCTARVRNAVGSSPASAPTAPFTVPATRPSPPWSAAATIAGTTMSVSFSGVGDDGGSPITGYGATCRSDDGGEARSASGTTSPIDITGLTRGRHYQCAVTASNGVGVSEESTATPRTLVPVVVPGKPRDVTVEAVGSTAIRVSFAPPHDDGGSAVISYRAECASPSLGGSLAAVGSSSPLVVPVSRTGVSLLCEVMATNAAGQGAAAAAPAAITISAPAPPSSDPVPPVPPAPPVVPPVEPQPPTPVKPIAPDPAPQVTTGQPGARQGPEGVGPAPRSGALVMSRNAVMAPRALAAAVGLKVPAGARVRIGLRPGTKGLRVVRGQVMALRPGTYRLTLSVARPGGRTTTHAVPVRVR